MRCGGAGLRRRELSLAAMALVSSVDAEDAVIDFSSAGLYVAGIQTVFAVVSVAVVSVLACWIAPENGVSAVRTLALCSATGAALMRAPLRIGRTHGVNVVFSSLQPAIVLYLMALVVEQLIHTCSIETTTAPSWRKVVFHAMTIVMTVAGVMRARAPMSDTDLPFLATASALLVIAVLPPQSVALVGPLCQQVGGWAAAERCLRALVFSALYSVHVYSSIAASSLTRTESLVVIARSAAAAVWTMASHVALLVVAVLQCTVVLTARIRIATANGAAPFRGVPTWRQTRRAPDTLVANLRDGEDMVGWWHRGAYGRSAFHRTVMAPYVFDTVVNVDTWRRIEQNGIYAVLVAIVARGADGSLRYVAPEARGAAYPDCHPDGCAASRRSAQEQRVPPHREPRADPPRSRSPAARSAGRRTSPRPTG